MTVQTSPGPLVTQGTEAAIGSATATTGATGASAGYVTGSDNPDAGPNAFFAGNLFKDMRFRAGASRGGESVGGYPNQAVGFVDHRLLTLDFVPSTIATANLAALQAPTISVPLTLVSAAGAGITITAAAITVLSTGNVVPAGVLQIDAAPAWNGYGTSGAMQGWTGAAAGRALSLTSVSNLSGFTFAVVGYDLWGVLQHETITGPNNTTVNSAKCYKWVVSVTPSATNGGTVSVGTADIFEFPVMARRFSQVGIFWNETPVGVNTGFTAAVTTSPATALTGNTRGSYAIQTASDGAKRLVVTQRLLPADMATLTTVFGVTQF